MKPAQSKALLDTLKSRFAANKARHPDLEWSAVLARIEGNATILKALAAMEASGGEPDVVVLDPKVAAWCLVDCSAESPESRRSLCFDDEALNARKENKPSGSALGMAASMGVRLLNENEYRALQALGNFDTKTSSWIETPASVRKLGGALFCDRRYGQVFTYHNGVQSYYAARGFRAILTL